MSPYEVLGVSPRATPDEIEDAYHRRLRQCHPDLHWANGPEAVAQAEAQTRAITAAMAQLRSEWEDSQRFATPPPGPSQPGQGAWGSGWGEQDEWQVKPQHESWSNFGYTPDAEHDWFGQPLDPKRRTRSDHVDCPLCGARHTDPHAYRYHLASAHQIDDPAVGLNPTAAKPRSSKGAAGRDRAPKAPRKPIGSSLGYMPWPAFWLFVGLFIYWMCVASFVPTFLLRVIGVWAGVIGYLVLLRLAFKYRRPR